MPLATYTRQTYPLAAARLLAQREMARRGLTWQRSAEDEALWQACRWDYALFGKTFLLHWCPDAFNQVHLDYYKELRIRQGKHGCFDAIAAPRESSKTTGCCMLAILHDCVYITEKYIVYFTNRYEDAADKAKDMRDELETNPNLLRVYGPQKSPVWNQSDWTTAHGVRVRAAGAKTQVRGITEKGQRPTKVVIDDVEHWEHVENEEQRIKTWRWLTSDVLKLGQSITSYEVWGTILNEHAMLKTLLKTPGWTTRFYQSVIQFADADAIPLWQHWRDIYIALDNSTRETDARAFFESHQDAMLKGSAVLWPERRDYYDLMVRRLREGESSWWQELQNQPLGDERHVFDMAGAAYCTVLPTGILRAGGSLIPWSDVVEVAAYWDPVADKKDIRGTDYACCTVMAQDRAGYLYILDAYVEQQTSTNAQIQAIVQKLWTWDCRLLGIESNGFQSLLPSNMREALAARALAERVPNFQATLVGIVNVRNKQLRIGSLEPLVNNHWLQFAQGLPAEFLRQFAEWIPVDGHGHDDVPDSVEGAVRVIRHQYEKRDVV